MQRRRFVKFLGVVSTSIYLTPSSVWSGTNPNRNKTLATMDFKGIRPSDLDDVVLSEELNYDVIIQWGEAINETESFGFNNDFLEFISLEKNNTDALLWVNHEYCDRFFINPGLTEDISKEDVKREMNSVGGSIIRIRKNEFSNRWRFEKNNKYNRRITGHTMIPFANEIAIKNSRNAMGMVGNCAGGRTPWDTVLTCEENYDMFYGETRYVEGKEIHKPSELGWEKFYANPPEHYGWVVEVDPYSGEAKKHISMGRFAHECAKVVKTKDKKIVVYSGDDANNECLYKFISDKSNDLNTGRLFVANLERGEWIPLDYHSDERLRSRFNDKTEMLIRTREAAIIVGGTPLDRPEDIEIHPVTGDVFVSLTNNKPKKNYHGSILKIIEDKKDHTSLRFKHEYFLMGGEAGGFSCPDNLAFDNKGNLWFTSDISNPKEAKPEYAPFKNNGLFKVPISGRNAGKPMQIASAPNNAEFTGPVFSPDHKTLFLSVQHPGEYSKRKDRLISHWPNGGDAIPKPGVIAIYIKD